MRACGETGKRIALKMQGLRQCQFESDYAHQNARMAESVDAVVLGTTVYMTCRFKSCCVHYLILQHFTKHFKYAIIK